MDIEISFVGTQKGLEAKVLPREGFELKTILSAGLLGKKRLSRWMSWVKLPVGTAQSMCFLIRKRIIKTRCVCLDFRVGSTE